jgi:hypothetical protein
MKTILIIPDCQTKPGVPLEHLDWLGKYITRIKPDVIVNLGDFFDMPSLSSYDKGTAKIEGKRVVEDIEFSKKALERVTKPLEKLKGKGVGYDPRLVFLLGNHEQRLERYVNHNPELVGFLSYDSLGLKELGWEVHDFLSVVNIEGILFSHYFANPMSGRPYSGKAHGLLQRIGKSFVQGHRQELEYSCRELVDGDKQFGLIAGAFYLHDEGYKGYQGNKHWRGVIVLHETRDGWGDPMFVSMDYLRRKFGNAP